MNTVVNIADELFREIGENSSTSIPSIAFWLRTNIGMLNTLLLTSYSISPTTLEFSPEMGEEEKDIFKKMYHVYFYDFKIREGLGAASVDSILEVTSDGATVRKINRNEVSKSYIQMKKIDTDELKRMIGSYKSKNSTPIQVAGDDDIGGEPPADYRRIYTNG